MDTRHWKCQCGEEGSGFIPESCPRCEHYIDAKLTEAGFREGLSMYYLIHNRGLAITDLLGFGCESLDFNGHDHFTTKWESANCRCGCSGYSTHTEDIPTRYLWMSDDDIKAEVQAKKDAEARAKAEADRLAKIKKAQADLVAAQARVTTAQMNAERDLEKATSALASLQEGA